MIPVRRSRVTRIAPTPSASDRRPIDGLLTLLALVGDGGTLKPAFVSRQLGAPRPTRRPVMRQCREPLPASCTMEARCSRRKSITVLRESGCCLSDLWVH